MSHAHRHDSAESVEVTFAHVIPDILHAAFDEHERGFVVKEHAGVEELFPLREYIGRGRAGVFLRLMIRGRERGGFHSSKRGFVFSLVCLSLAMLNLRSEMFNPESYHRNLENIPITTPLISSVLTH